MTRARASCCLGLLIFSAVSGRSEEANRPVEPIRTLIFSGHNNHDWRTSTPYLRQLLVDAGRFDVRVCEEPSGVGTETLDAYGLLILDYQGPRWGPNTERAIETFVRSGRGLVVVHGASYAFSGLEILGDRHAPTGVTEPPWPEYAKMTGGVWGSKPKKTAHGLRHSFQVRFVDRNHPIAKGMRDSFVATDELYHNMRMQPEAHVLAVARSDPKTLGTGKDEPILWTVRYGEGRTFHTTLGHDLTAMQEPGFATTFTRGAEWAATGAVTLPANLPMLKSDAAPVRVLVVTGGHSYPTSFYSLFEGHEDLTWDHAPSSEEAFQQDIRQSYDVVVLYDMSRRIADEQRSNLRAFVESGKGLVVLHHAIADYSDWRWWYEEVVGGRYLLEPDGSQPASTFKHEEEMFIEAPDYRRGEGSHADDLNQAYRQQQAITRGVAPLHLRDETYKGMWISPKVTVLLQTDNPTSDAPVAWVSPYQKSRVIYIQPGHGRETHVNLGYRALVKKAILWSAGHI